MDNALAILSIVAAVLVVSYLALSRYVKRKNAQGRNEGEAPQA